MIIINDENSNLTLALNEENGMMVITQHEDLVLVDLPKETCEALAVALYNYAIRGRQNDRL